MARGKPDYHRATVIEAKYGSDFIPVVVDASGQMYIALTGQQIAVNNHPSDYFKEGELVVATGDVSVNNHPSDYLKENGDIASITNNVIVDQSDADRVLKGTEGANKRYIAVDSAGIILARLKGAEGATLRDVAVDSSGILLARMKGAFGATLKDIAIDTDGKIIGVFQGDDDGTLRNIYVDSSGKMVARIQGVGGGNESIFTIDDGGDEDTISDWAEGNDGLNPTSLSNFGKEGVYSMKLGVDASASGVASAYWQKDIDVGDLSQYSTKKVYISVYFSRIDRLIASGTAFQYVIGSSFDNVIWFSFTKADLSVGWNLLECDLDDPTATTGTIDWTDIDFQKLFVYEVASNTIDFYLVLDLISVVQVNPNEGVLQDLETDKDGLLLSKMVGSYGDLHKPITTDRYGNLRNNITKQDLWTQVCNKHKGAVLQKYCFRDHPSIEEYTMCDLTGPGVILGGHLFHSSTNAHHTCVPLITIDGQAFVGENFQDYDIRGLTSQFSNIPHLCNYDPTNGRYSVGFPSGITFNTQFKVVMDENIGATANSYLYLYYSLLQ